MAATATARSSTTRRRAPAKRGRTGHTPVTGFVPVAAAAGAVGGLADSRMFVWLTRGRLWIGLLGALLVGIVGLNVMALSFSAASSDAGQAADALRRQNSALHAQIASRLSNSEIQEVAAKLGLVMPGAGSFTYLEISPKDAEVAAQRLRDGELTAGVDSVAAVETTTAETLPVDTAPVEAAPVEAAATAPVVPAEEPVVDPVAPVAPEAGEAPVAPVETTAPAADPGSTAGAVGAP